MRKAVNAERIAPGRAHWIFLVGFSAVLSIQGAEWQVGVVDPVPGTYTSLRIDSYGNAHVAYAEESEANLKYSFWDRGLNRWFTTTLDRTVGFCSLVLDSKQHPHISYLDYGAGKLKYAYWNGSAWMKQTIEVPAKQISFYTSIALDAHDYPSITFYEYFGLEDDNVIRLRNVSWNGSFWQVRTVDPTAGSGKFNSIVSDSAGLPQVAYGNVKYENGSLRYARWTGQSWETEILEGAGLPGSVRWSVSMVLDHQDRPHITYVDVLNRLVKYITKVNGKWETQVVDSLAKVSYPDRNGIAVDEDGNPYISYYDVGAGVLKVAHREGHRWVTEVVDQNFAGFASSIQIHDGTIWVTYEDVAGKNLKFARRPIDRPDSAAAARPAHVTARLSQSR